MRITTAEIRRALDLLLSEFEVNGASEWVIEHDFYWDVPSDVRYDSYDSPQQLGMGQLEDDVQRVKDIASGSDDPVPPGLVWVASIIRLAGEKGVIAMKGPAQSKEPEPLFCNVGDQVEFTKAVAPTAWEGELTTTVAVGDRYSVVGLVGSGWDLQRISGNGPMELRLLNSQMKEYVKVKIADE